MSNKQTIKDILSQTIEILNKNNIRDAHFEAELLLAHALKTERIKLYSNFNKEVNGAKLKEFNNYISRRIKKEPTAYILGFQPFMSLDFKVTSDVLIPRPETELLVQGVLDIAKNFKNEVKILDIGTGSGAIAVTLAKNIEKAKIYATDLSKKALKIAKENAEKHKVAGKIIFEKADLFPKELVKFDIIVSNPPYIETKVIPKLQTEILKYEPVQALDGGADGLDFYRRMIKKLNGYINSYGFLLFETGFDQANTVRKMVEKELNPSDLRIKKDLSGIERIVLAKFNN